MKKYLHGENGGYPSIDILAHDLFVFYHVSTENSIKFHNWEDYWNFIEGCLFGNFKNMYLRTR